MPPTLQTIGIKPNQSYFHNTMRIIVAFLFLIIIMILLYFTSRAKQTYVACIEDIEDVIRPGTQFHDVLLDMKPIDRSKYIAVINGSLRDSNKTRVKKIYKALSVAVISGILAEYIIHGSLNKSIGILGKTSLNTTLATLIS